METQQMQRTLPLWGLIILGLAFMALTTVLFTYGIAANLSHGMVTGSYIVALGVMLFTAYSYGQMSRKYPIAGSAYAFTQRAIHPGVGFLVGWAILMAYIFLPVVSYILFGGYLHETFPLVPQWVFILIILTMVTLVNLRGVTFAVNSNFVVVTSAIIFLIVFAFLAIRLILAGEGTGTLLNLDPIYRPDTSIGYIIAGASLLCFSFLGFDSVTTFAEEVVNPRRNIPLAILFVTLIGGVVFISISYLSHNVWPDYESFITERDPTADGAGYAIVELVGGPILKAFFIAVTAMVLLGASISSQASAARILYAMGRDGQLPSMFGRLHPRFKTPTYNIILLGLISVSAIFLNLTFVVSFVNFGAYIAFIAVNLSVIFMLYRTEERTIKNYFLLLLLPAIGALLDLFLLINLDQTSLMLGVVWFAIGFAYLLYLTRGFKQAVPVLSISE